MKLNSKLRIFLSRSVSLGLLTSAASAAEIQKDAVANTNALNTGTAWVLGTAPGTTDVARWDSAVSATNLADSQTLTPLGGNVSWQGIKVTDVGGTRHVNSSSLSHIRILNASSANTLTLGSAGIDMSSALQALLIQSKITLAADQEWNVANAANIGSPFGFNNNEDLALQALAANTAFNLGGYALTLKGAGQITITSGHAISNGTINVQNNTKIQGGTSRVASLSDTVAVNITAGGNLRLQANGSGASLTSAADISVSGAGSTLDFGLSDGSGSSLVSSSGDISMATGTTLQITGGAGAFTQSGGVDFTGDVNWNHNGSNAHTNGAVVSGNLTGDGSVSFKNTNSNANGQVRLSGDNSLFTGTMTLNGASNNRALRLTSSTAGSAAATWAVDANNILQVDGVSVQLGTLNGAGTVTNSHASNAATLNVGAGTFSGAISDGATATTSLVKNNTLGTLTLGGTNLYTGATTVSAGKLTIGTGGTINGTSAINVAAGATLAYNSSTALTVAPTLNGTGTGSGQRAVLSGSGTINASVTLDNLGDTLSPGNSPGILSFGVGQTWASYSYDWELNDWAASVDGTDIDKINITGTLNLSAITDDQYRLNILSLMDNNTSGLVGAGGGTEFSEIDRSWVILTASGGITGFAANEWDINFAGFTDAEAGTWSISQNTNDLVLTYTVVPEPSAALLGGLGLLVLLRRRR